MPKIHAKSSSEEAIAKRNALLRLELEKYPNVSKVYRQDWLDKEIKDLATYSIKKILSSKPHPIVIGLSSSTGVDPIARLAGMRQMKFWDRLIGSFEDNISSHLAYYGESLRHEGAFESFIYELTIGATFRNFGYSIEFLPVEKGRRTSDIRAVSTKNTLFIECKRKDDFRGVPEKSKEQFDKICEEIYKNIRPPIHLNIIMPRVEDFVLPPVNEVIEAIKLGIKSSASRVDCGKIKINFSYDNSPKKADVNFYFPESDLTQHIKSILSSIQKNYSQLPFGELGVFCVNISSTQSNLPGNTKLDEIEKIIKKEFSIKKPGGGFSMSRISAVVLTDLVGIRPTKKGIEFITLERVIINSNALNPVPTTEGIFSRSEPVIEFIQNFLGTSKTKILEAETTQMPESWNK